MTDGAFHRQHHDIARQHHDIARQHHDIARQHHDHARRAAEQHRRAAWDGGHAGHPAGGSIRHGRGDQRGQLDWDRPMEHRWAAGTTRRRSGGGTVILAFLVVVLVLGGIAAAVLGADRVYQQGEERAKAAYCEQAAKVTGETPPGC